VDPADPARMVAAWQQDRIFGGGALGIVTAASADGGFSWRRSTPPLSVCSGGSYPRVSDPVASVGPGVGGSPIVAFLSAIGVRADRRTDVIASTSTDGGANWNPPVVVRSADDAIGGTDKEWLHTDPNRPGTAFLVWVEFPKPKAGEPRVFDVAFFSRTDDAGRTWSAPAEVYGALTETQFHQSAVLPDGTLYDAFTELRPRGGNGPAERIAVSRSADGGRTWGPAVTAADFTYSIVERPGQRIRADSLQFGLTSTPGDGLAVLWIEDPTLGDHRVLFARSGDEGRTWSAPTVITSGQGAVFVPQLASANRGSLGALWYEVEPTAGPGLPTDVWFASSADGGAHWDRQHVAGPFDLDRAAPSPEGDFVGDYQGLAGLPDGFVLLWSMPHPLPRTSPATVFFTAARPRPPVLRLP